MIVEVIHLQEGVSNATLTAYLHDTPIDNHQYSGRAAVVICPGGAFLGYSEKEAEPVALKLLSEGYDAFVLKYSIGSDMARFPAPFIDAAKAVMIVRENTRRWGIDPGKIYLCGFSTGGYVAASLAATWQEDYLAKALNTDNTLIKPDALLLGYPLLDMYQFQKMNIDKSPEMKTLMEMMFLAIYGTAEPSKALMEQWSIKKQITSQHPPTFLWTTSRDSFVAVEESMDYIKELAVNRILYEFHIFEKGEHGMSLGNHTVGYTEDEVKKQVNAPKWVELALNWLNSSNT